MPLPSDNVLPATHVVIHALDRSEVLADLLRLIFLAGESLGDPNGAAIARAAMIAADELGAVRDALEHGAGDTPAA